MGGDRAGREPRRDQAGRTGLDGPTLAKIFLGKIKNWDDPAIKKLNPNVKLPAQAIVVVHRSDGSGTTFNFDLLPVEGEPRLEIDSRRSTLRSNGRLASALKAMRASPTTWPDQRLDRLRGVRLRAAEQDGLHQDDQQGRQDRSARRLPPFRPRPPTQTGIRCRATVSSWPISRGADSWPMPAATFILIPKQPTGPGGRGRSAQVLRLGLCQGRQNGGGTRLRSDAEKSRR